MSKGAGKDFLIKIDTGASVFVTLGGLRSSSFTAAAGEIDVTSIDSAQWQELLDGAGVKSVGLAGSGVLDDAAPLAALRTAFLNQTLTAFKLVEKSGTWEGSFKITSLELAGEHSKEQTYSIKLASSGAVSFT